MRVTGYGGNEVQFMLCGTLSPQHGTSLGCWWRK